MPSEKWKDNFRIPRATFYSLCDILRAHIELKTTKMQDTVDVERQIAMTLYYLADEGRMGKTAIAFGLSHSTVSVIARRVCSSAICEHMGPQLIRLPKTQAEVLEKTNKFFQSLAVSDVFGSS